MWFRIVLITFFVMYVSHAFHEIAHVLMALALGYRRIRIFIGVRPGCRYLFRWDPQRGPIRRIVVGCWGGGCVYFGGRKERWRRFLVCFAGPFINAVLFILGIVLFLTYYDERSFSLNCLERWWLVALVFLNGGAFSFNLLRGVFGHETDFFQMFSILRKRPLHN